MIDNSYADARGNAKDILLYSWDQFDEKTEEYFDRFNEKPLSNTDPIGEDFQSIEIDPIIIGLRKVKKELYDEIMYDSMHSGINQNPTEPVLFPVNEVDISSPSEESMSNEHIGALQVIIDKYSMHKIVNTMAIVADQKGHDDAAQKLADLASSLPVYEDPIQQDHNDAEAEEMGRKYGSDDWVDAQRNA